MCCRDSNSNLSLQSIWKIGCPNDSTTLICHRFRDAAGNFLKSPAVQEFSKNLYALYEHALEHGFWSTFQQLIDSLDPLGEKTALRVRDDLDPSLGSGCSTAVGHTPYDNEVVGSNPAGCWVFSYLLNPISGVALMVPHGDVKLLIFPI